MSKEQLSLGIRHLKNLLIFGLLLMAVNYFLNANAYLVWAATLAVAAPPALIIATIFYSIYLLIKGKFFSRRPTLISIVYFLILFLFLSYPLFNIGPFKTVYIFTHSSCTVMPFNTISNLVDSLPCLLLTLGYWMALPLVLCGLPILITSQIIKHGK